MTYDGPDYTVRLHLLLALEQYEEKRRDYFASDPSFDQLMRIYDILAETFLSSSLDLLFAPPDPDEKWKKQPTSPWAHVVAMVEDQGHWEHFDEAIAIRLAEDQIDRLPEAIERCLHLAKHIVGARPSESVARYLARLGRCYIAGFLPECVMLCRSVLENAVKDAFVRHGIPLPATEAGHSPMRARLDAAKRFGWLSTEAYNDAWRVWTRGNKAVHDDPEATADVLGTVVMTSRILQELYKGT